MLPKALIHRLHRKTKREGRGQAQPKHTALFPYCLTPLNQLLKLCVLRRPGGYGGAAATDPLPHRDVELSCYKGTSSREACEYVSTRTLKHTSNLLLNQVQHSSTKR